MEESDSQDEMVPFNERLKEHRETVARAKEEAAALFPDYPRPTLEKHALMVYQKYKSTDIREFRAVMYNGPMGDYIAEEHARLRLALFVVPHDLKYFKRRVFQLKPLDEVFFQIVALVVFVGPSPCSLQTLCDTRDRLGFSPFLSWSIRQVMPNEPGTRPICEFEKRDDELTDREARALAKQAHHIQLKHFAEVRRDGNPVLRSVVMFSEQGDQYANLNSDGDEFCDP